MSETKFHWLSKGVTKFDHVAVAGKDFELCIDWMRLQMNIEIAEQVVDILRNYIEDEQRSREEYLRAADVVAKKIKETSDGL